MDRNRDKRKREKKKLICYYIYYGILPFIIGIVIKSYIDGNIPLIVMILIFGICILITYLIMVYISKHFKKKIEEDRKKRVNRF